MEVLPYEQVMTSEVHKEDANPNAHKHLMQQN